VGRAISGPMQVGRGRIRYRAEPALFIDRREVNGGERLLAVFEIVANAQQIDDRDKRAETDERPDDRQDDEDAAPQRLTGCGWRRGTTRREWRPRP
jgi:hypothetical protein